MGLHVADIIAGYEAAGRAVVKIMPSLEVDKCQNLADKTEVCDQVYGSQGVCSHVGALSTVCR